jgi:hypothetical protein
VSNGPRLFISHSREDRGIARTIATMLVEAGFSVRTDDQLDDRARLRSEINAEIGPSVGVIVVMSPAAKASVWVERDVRHAQGRGLLIFPVFVAGDARTTAPLWLADYASFDLREPGELDRLVAELRQRYAMYFDTDDPQETIRDLKLVLSSSLDHDVASVLEPLLNAVTDAIEEGRFDDDPLALRMIERDRASLHAELYENPDAADTAIILATAYRVLRTLAPAAEAEVLDLLPRATTDPLDADGALDAVDAFAQAAGESPIVERSGLTTFEWIAVQLGWFPYALGDSVKRARTTMATSAPEFVGTSSGVAGVLAVLGLSGPAATLVGVYAGLLALAWKNAGPD